MKTLVLCEDAAHPADLTREGLQGLGECGCEFDFVVDAGNVSSDRLKEYPLIVFSKANQKSGEDKAPWADDATGQVYTDYVKRGNSILFTHSGTAVYKDLPSFRSLMGGVFVGHPPQCDVTVEPKDDHPLTEGSDTFTLRDEHYMMEMYDDDVDVFLTSNSEHGSQPAGWTRTEGDGRVCVLTPGHHVNVWHHPAYLPVLANCLAWCKAPLND